LTSSAFRASNSRGLSQRDVRERTLGSNPDHESDRLNLRRYTFEEFRDHLLKTVEQMNAGLEDPEATWPGVLFLEQGDDFSLPARSLRARAAR
jgi:hypothetical protein